MKMQTAALQPASWQARLEDVSRALHVLEQRVADRRSVGLEKRATVQAARELNQASGLLAFSVLADSAVEHYRGSFENRTMFAPLVVAALTLGVSAHGTADRRTGVHRLRGLTYGLAGVTGVVGSGFHAYNVMKRPGRLSWQNLFYGAPLGAPAALVLSGLFGVCAERLRDQRGPTPRLFGLPAGRALAALAGVGLLGTSGEAGLLHFRGAFNNPAMLAPVTIPPVGALLLENAAFGRGKRSRWLTRWWLKATALMGFAGVGFHAYGVSRSMGGWRNWSQNVLSGPPLPAPPSFTGLALAGLAALHLLEDRRNG